MRALSRQTRRVPFAIRTAEVRFWQCELVLDTLLLDPRSREDMAKKHFVRREPRPKRHKGVVAVTYEQVIDGNGNVTLETPIRAAGCRTDGCESQWFNARTKGESSF